MIYIGWIAIALAIYSIYSLRQSREITPWIWMGIIFSSLAWVLILMWEEAIWRLMAKKFPSPFLALYKAFPIFDRISHPFRFTVGVELAIAVLAAHGLRTFFRGRTQRAKIGLLCALGFGI